MTISIYQNPFVFEKHNQSFSDYIGLCIKHHKDEKGANTENHHIFPKHKGGAKNRWNMVHLDYELHIEAHRLLMEAFPEDEPLKKSYRGTKNRGSHRGEGNPMFGKPNPCSAETRVKISKTLTGKTPTNKGKTGGKRTRVICEYCQKEVAINVYRRHHGPKCKNRL